MRKVSLTNKRLKFHRILTTRFSTFRRGDQGCFAKKVKKLFRTFTVRRKILLKSNFSPLYRMVITLKMTRLYKILTKNNHFIRRFYGDMKHRELKRLGRHFVKNNNIKTKRFGRLNLI